MVNKGRLIFEILILVSVPVFAFSIWKELGSGSENGLEDNLNKKVTQSAASQSNQVNSKTTSVNPQNNVETSDSQKVAAAEDITENKENSTANNNEDKNNYKNENLGISFDYPKEYAVAYGGNKIVTISKESISWKIRFYDDKDKSDVQIWFGNHFNKKDNLDCSFVEPEIKAGTYEGKLVKPGTDAGKCADEGSYAINSDKTKIIRVYEDKETKENINNILESFKFL